MTDLTPREIVSELDRFIIGQKDAKRAVALDEAIATYLENGRLPSRFATGGGESSCQTICVKRFIPRIS